MTVRQPRSVVHVNGEATPAWVEWDLDSNAFYQADTFRCSLATSKMVDGRGMSWWLAQKDLEIEIFAGFPANPDRYTSADLESIFVGRVDDLDWALDGARVSVHGRDLTGLLIDTKTSEKYRNRKASEIVAEIAEKHGLTAVITETTEQVGKFYDQDKVRLQTEQTEWDLLTWLAREEGFQVYIQGRELHFGPPATDGDPYVIQWQNRTDGPPRLNGTGLSLTRSYTLAKGIKVTVKTWNAKKKRAFSRTASRGGGKNVQEYSYVVPGLTGDQAEARARQLLAELSAHEIKLKVTGPASNALKIGQKIELRGTDTTADQTFYPDSINRRMSARDGYVWTVSAKNHSPESEPAL